MEGELSRRVSGMEAGFRDERATMKETLAGERLASKAKLEEVLQTYYRQSVVRYFFFVIIHVTLGVCMCFCLCVLMLAFF